MSEEFSVINIHEFSHFHVHSRTGISCVQVYLFSLHHQMEHLWLDIYTHQKVDVVGWFLVLCFAQPSYQAVNVTF